MSIAHCLQTIPRQLSQSAYLNANEEKARLSRFDKSLRTRSLILIRAELMELYKDFCKNYPVITIEDPFDQDDWENTTAFTAEGVSQVHPP